MSPKRCSLMAWCLLVGAVVAVTMTASAQAPSTPEALDRKLIDIAKTNSEVMANLSHLCDHIGPRLTGSKNLQRAGEWAAAKMKSFGLANVHLEPWSMPEGWQRGPASARIVEPDNGVTLTVASLAWHPGTEGKITGDVIVLNATTTKELAAYKGKLKGAIVLAGEPRKVLPLDQLERPEGSIVRAFETDRSPRPTNTNFTRERNDFLVKEGAAALVQDAGKPLNLLYTTGGWSGKDRPSASQRLPTVVIANNQYRMLHRLASRPAPARTRLELEVKNTFVPGPLPVHNVVGEIRGSDKQDEVVVLGAHLDSWDLGQGTTDNGTGSSVILETARVLMKSGIKPRRTIRFILFTGEEQGLHGSRAYVEQHKEELPRISACIVHDTGTGKVVGFEAGHRPVLQPIFEKEMVSLRELGVTNFQSAFSGGSDHAPFDRAGVPGMACRQEVAGYRVNHHTQADTLDRAIEGNLIQGVQVLSVAALRIANLDKLLPRERAERRNPPGASTNEKPQRMELDDLGKLVGLNDPQISPDGKSVVVVVSRPNYERNRSEAELVLVDVATGKHRVLTHDRQGIGQPRWSPTGDRLAFLTVSGAGKHQIHIMPMNGGDSRRITDVPQGVQHYAWKPDGSGLAFATADEAPKKNKDDDAFEVGNDGYLTSAAPTSSHIWLVSSDGGAAKRLTSGTWSLELAPPPNTPASPLSWSPDGKSIAFVSQEKPNIGDRNKRRVQIVDVESGKIRAVTDQTMNEGTPSFSPDGSKVAYWYPRDGDSMNNNEIWLVDAAGGKGKSLTRELDRCLYQSQWMPDGKTLLVGGNDGTRVSMWLQPLDGAARRLELGGVRPSWSFRVDATVGKTGVIAFTGTSPDRPAELYFMDSPTATPRRLTDFNREVASRQLGKTRTITWRTHDDFQADGIVTLPPEFDAQKQYPLVLLIHGGPASASTEVFSHRAQLMAAQGYIVFEPNYRGSDNLGNAYKRAIFRDQGEGPGKDVMAGLDAVKKHFPIDEKRIAVTGWSYGGYMTTWLIGHHHIWKTAIAGAAVTDLVDQYNLSDGNVARRQAYGGSPWSSDQEKFYREQSPITYANKVKTPTLILATTGDARVTVTQSYKFYHALKDNGVPVKFVAYPVSGHYPADPVRQKDLLKRWLGWLDEHLR